MLRLFVLSFFDLFSIFFYVIQLQLCLYFVFYAVLFNFVMIIYQTIVHIDIYFEKNFVNFYKRLNLIVTILYIVYYFFLFCVLFLLFYSLHCLFKKNFHWRFYFAHNICFVHFLRFFNVFIFFIYFLIRFIQCFIYFINDFFTTKQTHSIYFMI